MEIMHFYIQKINAFKTVIATFLDLQLTKIK